MPSTRSPSLAALALAAFVAFVALLFSASPAAAWPNNAGTVCSTSSSDIQSIAMSRHGSAGSGGYSVSAISASSGSGYQVTVSGGSSYTGIVLLARDASGNLVGSFSGYPSGLSAKTDCGGPVGSILEHNSASRKSFPLTVTWNAGSSSVSDGSQITFEAIVVQTTRSWSVASAGSIIYAASGSSSSGSDNSAATTQPAAAATTQSAPVATQSASNGNTRTRSNIAVPTGTSNSRPTGSMSGSRPTDFPSSGSSNNSTGATGSRPSGGHGHHDEDDDSSSSSSSSGSTSSGHQDGDGDGDRGSSSSSSSSSSSNDNGSSTSPASNSNSASSGTSTVSSSQQSSSTSSSPNPAVIGAAVGAGVACAGLLGGLGIFLSRRNKKSKEARERAMESATNLAPSSTVLDAQLESSEPVGYEVDYQGFVPKNSYLAEGEEYPALAMQSSNTASRV